ncbi:MAG TPA: hypothetical protein VGJ00_10385 [Rhabdochlamydiaceae bacterium]
MIHLITIQELQLAETGIVISIVSKIADNFLMRILCASGNYQQALNGHNN